MKELGPEAREFVDSHRRDRSLSQGDRARMKQKLMLRVSTLGATTAVAGTAAGMSLASKVLVVALGVSGVVGAGSFSLWAVRSGPSPVATPVARSSRVAREGVMAAGSQGEPRVSAEGRTVAEAPPTASADRSAAPASGRTGGPAGAPRVARNRTWNARATAGPSVPARPLAPEPTPMVAVPRARSISEPVGTSSGVSSALGAPAVGAAETERPKNVPAPAAVAPPETATAVAARDPEPELRALRDARDDLRAGHPARAYRRLEEFERQSGGGMLAQERSALSAIALCQWQPGAPARARAAAFLRHAPESPLAARVRSSCEQARKASP